MSYVITQSMFEISAWKFVSSQVRTGYNIDWYNLKKKLLKPASSSHLKRRMTEIVLTWFLASFRKFFSTTPLSRVSKGTSKRPPPPPGAAKLGQSTGTARVIIVFMAWMGRIDFLGQSGPPNRRLVLSKAFRGIRFISAIINFSPFLHHHDHLTLRSRGSPYSALSIAGLILTKYVLQHSPSKLFGTFTNTNTLLSSVETLPVLHSHICGTICLTKNTVS